MKCTECIFFENPSYVEGGEVYQADYAKCRLYGIIMEGVYEGQDEHDGAIWDFSNYECPHPNETKEVIKIINKVKKDVKGGKQDGKNFKSYSA